MEELTVAVNRTDRPTFEGFTDELITVFVVALLTFSTVLVLLEADRLSPLYTDTTVREPAGNLEVVSTAVPPVKGLIQAWCSQLRM